MSMLLLDVVQIFCVEELDTEPDDPALCPCLERNVISSHILAFLTPGERLIHCTLLLSWSVVPPEISTPY